MHGVRAESALDLVAEEAKDGPGLPSGGGCTKRTVGWSSALSVLVWAALGISGPSAQPAPTQRAAPCHSWKYVSSPTYAAAQLSGVTAASSSDVWAVGNLLGLNPLIQHWDGSVWTQVPQPATFGILRSAVAVSDVDVWTVGSIDGLRTLIEHWDGTTWSVIPSPSPGNPDNFLNGVAALSASDIWAAGYHSAPNGSIQPLYEHWDGESWTVVREAPGTPNNGGEIYGIHAISTTDVWAVGYQGSPVSIAVPLIEHWDGHSWHVVKAAPVHQGTIDRLGGVFGTASNDVWAVGFSENGGFIEHWDGVTWARTQSVPLGPLIGIDGSGPMDIWAVGNLSVEPLTEHWDGTSWTRVGAALHGQSTGLAAVAAPSPSNIWTVGTFIPTGGGGGSPATEHSNGVCA